MNNHADMKARSPWALRDVHVAEISPAANPIIGELVVPGSKSFTNRALILAAVAKGRSRVDGILKSDDSYWCIDTLKKLGIDIQVDGYTATVEGCDGSWPVSEANVYVGAAGTTARFLPGMLAAAKEGNWVVEGSERMNERPMLPLLQALRDLGANLTYLGQEGHLPIRVLGTGLQGGMVNISGSTSSQFISGLLQACVYANEPVQIQITDHIVQHAYVKITLDLMRQFGAKIEHDAELTTITVYPGRYEARDVVLEADASTAGYFFALAALTNGRVRVNNLSYQTNQPDIALVDILEKMGCEVTRGDDFVEVRGTEQLKGGFDISMKELSDQTLTLAVLAVFADGPIAIHDVGHIRMHESDRIRVICEALKQVGIQTEERDDGLTVYPGTPSAATLGSHDDHRVAMALSMLGAKVPGIRILDPGCISKTCPTFYEEIRKLGLQVELQ